MYEVRAYDEFGHHDDECRVRFGKPEPDANMAQLEVNDGSQEVRVLLDQETVIGLMVQFGSFAANT